MKQRYDKQQYEKQQYDIIIIGAGIAGLYSAYKIKQLSPSKTVLVLERDKKEWIGGRIGNDWFYGQQIVTGAGVGRKKKDKYLIELLNELHIPTKECLIEMNYAKSVPTVINIPKAIHFLKQKYESYKVKPNSTFSVFAKHVLGEKLYKDFTTTAGYTDYENEDIEEVLYHYGMNDNSPHWISLIVPWKQLVTKLCDKIGWENVKYKHTALHIFPLTNGFQIETNKGNYFSKKVIVATNINSILKLVPGADSPNSIYKEIGGQPFLRVYGKFDKKSDEIMKQFVPTQTIVAGPLHKLIPYDNGVYMIAYTDNEGALALKDHLQNNLQNRELFEDLLEVSLGIPKNTIHLTAIKGYYWPIGTHYYKPYSVQYKNRNQFIEKIQHPLPNMLVVGEVVSKNQGWTEGALSSVHLVLNKKWIDGN